MDPTFTEEDAGSLAALVKAEASISAKTEGDGGEDSL
jgi:hypothetical protein